MHEGQLLPVALRTLVLESVLPQDDQASTGA